MNFRRLTIIVLAVAIVLVARYRFPKDRDAKPYDVVTTPGPYDRPDPSATTGPDADRTTAGGITLTDTALHVAPQLNAPNGSVDEDLQALDTILAAYTTATGTTPAGLNGDVTPLLLGQNPTRTAYIAPGHPAVDPDNDVLLDRWGTPFYIGPASGDTRELRSAGPDRELFTPDDAVLQR